MNGIGIEITPLSIAKNNANLNPFLCSYPPKYAVIGPLEAAPAVGLVIQMIANPI